MRSDKSLKDHQIEAAVRKFNLCENVKERNVDVICHIT